MLDMVEFTDYRDSISVRVGEFLLIKGFYLGDSVGMALGPLVHEHDSLSVLYKNPEAKLQKSFFGLIKKPEPRRIFLGTIWFNNEARRADEKNWVFETRGRKYVGLVKRLSDDLVSTFDVKISIRFLHEQPEFETFLSDYSM